MRGEAGWEAGRVGSGGCQPGFQRGHVEERMTIPKQANKEACLCKGIRTSDSERGVVFEWFFSFKFLAHSEEVDCSSIEKKIPSSFVLNKLSNYLLSL